MSRSHRASSPQDDTRTKSPDTARREGATRIKPKRPGQSSDWRVKLAHKMGEALVNAAQHAALNTFSGRVHPARHTMEARNLRSR